jgi:hypothetical protein
MEAKEDHQGKKSAAGVRIEAEATSLLRNALSHADVDASNSGQGGPRDEAKEKRVHGILKDR